MIFIDVAEELVGRHGLRGTVRAIARWIPGFLAERRRRAVLQDLLFAPEHRLRDIGVSRDVLLQAIEQQR